MGKLNELNTTQGIVKNMLEFEPDTRNSDALLYVRICSSINPKCEKLSFPAVMLNKDRLGIPGFETVRRARQKIQHDNPELAGCDQVEAQRVLNEEVFREYARG